MATSKSDTRVFTKTLRDGTVQRRTVTSVPSSEVAARFDGFLPEPETKSTSGSSKPASSPS